jgi:hypothetical protein
MSNKWDIPGWGAAQARIREAPYFLIEGKGPAERLQISEEVVAAIRAIVRGDRPGLQTSPFNRDEHFREMWARMVAHSLVGAALGASERSPSSGLAPSPDQQALLREVAREALWHMRSAPEEARDLAKFLTLERMRQPHPGDVLDEAEVKQ